MSDEGDITLTHLIWDVVVFIAVIVSVVSVLAEVVFDLSEEEIIVLYIIDFAALAIFVADLWFLWRHYRGPLKGFIFRNWLDILSAIPIFRIIRVARFARVVKLARLRRLNKLNRVEELKK